MSNISDKAFLRPGKLALLFFAGVVVYFLAVIFLVPAGWLWQQASGQIRLPPQVRIHQVAGTLWDGQAKISVQGMSAQVDWQLGTPLVASLALPLSFQATTGQSLLSGTLEASASGEVSLRASGQVHVAEFESLIRQSGGAMLEGNISIDRLNLVLADNRIKDATGYGRWPGGRVSWPMGGRTQSASFPPMEASLASADNGVSLTVGEQGAEGPAATANILANGMLEIRVYKRMVDLAGQPWSGAARPGDVIFSVRQPLLPGGRF